MEDSFSQFTVLEHTKIIDALIKIDLNKQGFVIVVDRKNLVKGVLTDGDVRRALIKGYSVNDSISSVFTDDAKMVSSCDGFDKVIELFKNQRIKFLPIVNNEGVLLNIITKSQMHALLLLDIHTDLSYDFLSLDTSVVDHEIFQRPWGFYKTTVLNDYYQGKVISIKPGGQLSLQSHYHREEHWIVVHGTGKVQLDESVISVICGSVVFIPKGCKHRITNTDECENLIITEVQIGDYLGEDDIIRYEDLYGRV